MDELTDYIIAAQQAAREGKRPHEILRLLLSQVKSNWPGHIPIVGIERCLMKAFDIPLWEVRDIEAWQGFRRRGTFTDARGMLTDAEVDTLLDPWIGRYLKSDSAPVPDEERVRSELRGPVIVLSRQPISKWPTDLFLKDTIEQLMLMHCDLEVLPPPIGNLTQLQVLHAGWNRLRALPETMGNLTCLEILALNNNQLNNLPPSIAHLQRLKELLLDKNCFDQFHKAFCNCANCKRYG